MLNIPEEIKALYRKNNRSKETARTVKLRFYDKKIDLLYPGDDVFPSDELFPIDDTPSLVIDKDQIYYESLEISQILTDEPSLTFGECCATEVEITVADVTMDVTGKEFVLTLEVGGYEMMLGIYKVDSFIRQADRRLRKITAYNRMCNFDIDVSTWYRGLTFPMTLKEFRTSICDYIGIKQNDTVLPLDDMQITRTVDPSQLSGRDVMKSICEINGCFGQVDVTGRFKYVFLGASSLYPSEDLYPDEDLYPSQLEGEMLRHYNPSGTTYEDYLVYGIDNVQIRQEEGDIGASFGGGSNAYIIQGNFLVYGKSAEELMQIASSVYDTISGKMYRPCKIVTSALPWVEVGDGLICHTSDDVIETYCLERTMKGIQAMVDTYEAKGTQERQQSFGISDQIIQLEGKTAILKRSVEEVSVKVTDLKAETESQFKQTAEKITAEVTRAQQAESQLSIKADEISTSVTNLKNDTNSKFQQTSEQIALKVSKGNVSSELSVESGKVTISGNRLIVDSTNFKLDGDGNATFSGRVQGAEVIGCYFAGGAIYIGNGLLVANDSEVRLGDYQVSADGTNELHSSDGSIAIQTAKGGPFGKYAAIKLSSEAGTTILSDHHLETTLLDAKNINGDCKLYGTNWWKNYTLFEALDWLYNEIKSLKS